MTTISRAETSSAWSYRRRSWIWSWGSLGVGANMRSGRARSRRLARETMPTGDCPCMGEGAMQARTSGEARRAAEKEERILHWMRPECGSKVVRAGWLFAGAGVAIHTGSKAGDVDGSVGAELLGAVFVEEDDGEVGGFDIKL